MAQERICCRQQKQVVPTSHQVFLLKVDVEHIFKEHWLAGGQAVSLQPPAGPALGYTEQSPRVLWALTIQGKAPVYCFLGLTVSPEGFAENADPGGPSLGLSVPWAGFRPLCFQGVLWWVCVEGGGRVGSTIKGSVSETRQRLPWLTHFPVNPAPFFAVLQQGLHFCTRPCPLLYGNTILTDTRGNFQV